MPHNILRILVEGAGRAELCGLEDGEYLEADVCEIPDIVEEGLPGRGYAQKSAGYF